MPIKPAAPRRDIAQCLADAAVRRNLPVSLGRRRRIGLCQFGGPAHARQRAIGGRAGLRDLRKQLCGLAVLAAVSELDGVFELRADERRLPRLPPFEDTPAADPDHNEEDGPDNGNPEPRVQLLELLSADLFIDFAKDVGHV
jgi:hypothetical protein